MKNCLSVKNKLPKISPPLSEPAYKPFNTGHIHPGLNAGTAWFPEKEYCNPPLKKIFAGILLFILTSSACLCGYTPSGPLSYSNRSNIVIDGKSFTSGSNGASITLTNCTNVTIINCSFVLNKDIIGIQLNSCTNIEIRGNYFEKFRTGVYAVTCKGGINISCNSFKDIAGIYPRGQIVQFNKCYGGGNRVNYNILDHTFGAGDPEDLINMYGSYGTSSDPIQIIGNKLRGGGPSKSGGGIMIGDDGGHDIRVEDNILVNVGQYGIGCPAGYNMTIKNNKVYGQSFTWTNVGMYVGLPGEIAAGFPCEGSKIRVENNQVKFYSKTGALNSWWGCPCCPGVILSGNNFNAPIDASILPAVLTLDSTACGAAAATATRTGTSQPAATFTRTATAAATSTLTMTPTPAVFSVAGTVQCEDYLAGEGTGYHDTDTVNTGGVYRGDGVDIQACADAGGGYNIGWTKAGEWLTYKINITQAGVYDIKVRVASSGAGGTFHLEIDGVNVSGTQTVPDTTGWQVWQDVVISNINAGSGMKTLKLAMDSAGASGSVGNFNYITFSINNTPTPSRTATFTNSPTSQVPSPTLTATKTNSPVPPAVTSTFTATRTGIPVPPTATDTVQPPSATYTFTSTKTNTPIPPTATRTNTAIPPGATATESFTVTRTTSAVNSPTSTSTFPFSQTHTRTFTPTGTPENTSTYTETAVFTPTCAFTETAAHSTTATPSLSVTRTDTATPGPTASATATAVKTATATEEDVFEFTPGKPVIPFPNPCKPGADMYVQFRLTKAAEKGSVKLYTGAYRFVLDVKLQGELTAGENTAKIPGRNTAGLSPGSYYFVVEAESREAERARSKTGVIIILK